MGDWSVILPEASTNMVLNPVAMGVGNYTTTGAATLSIVEDRSYLGYRCYRLNTVNSGALSLTLSPLTNIIHYVTYRIHNQSSTLSLPLISLDGGNNFVTPTLICIEGDWVVFGGPVSAAQCNGSTSVQILDNIASLTYTLYIGHVQVEIGEVPTTPITGDIKGFYSNGYYWNGTPHASTSTRAANERSGGLEVDLETSYNFNVRYGEGSGMPPITHHTQGMALLPGALHQGHKVEPRVLDLVSITDSDSAESAALARKNFINAIKPDRISPEQPIIFRYSGANSNKPVDYYCYYDSGMELSGQGGIVDQPTARFICYDPFAYETHTESAALTTSQTVSNADYIVRKINGTWYNISTDFQHVVRALTCSIDGCIYIGGDFHDVGDANGDFIVKWNPYTSTISSLSTGSTGSIYALATASNGDIYLGGSFTNLGDANGDYISRWDGAIFNSLSTGLPLNVNALVIGQDGTLYVGGTFENVTDANGDRITKWNGTAFSSLGTGMNGDVNALAIAPNGDLYATGQFTLAGGVSNTAYIARWNGTAWLPLGTGLDDTGYALAFDKAGNLYVGGAFHNADNVACAHIAKWNGKTFEPLGSGLNDYCSCLALDNNGLLYAGGLFTTAGGIALSDRIAIWNGTTWSHVSVNLPGSPYVDTILPTNNNLYIGYSTEGNATTSYLNTITNSGSSSAYPIIYIHRANDGTTGTLELIKNETTGDTLWCNYALIRGETLTIDLTPGNRSIKSSYFGDVWRAVLRSSDLSSFRLLPGANSISAFVNTDATITAWMEWKITHWGADMVAA